MSLNIELPADIERILRRRAAAVGTDLESFVRQVVTECAITDESVAPERRIPHAEFMSRIHEIIAMHPKSKGKLDDSRESIYAGRGE